MLVSQRGTTFLAACNHAWHKTRQAGFCAAIGPSGGVHFEELDELSLMQALVFATEGF